MKVTDLVKAVREFWYNNLSGNFAFGNLEVTRAMLHKYGGPNTSLSCPKCQEMEWRSRLLQENLYGEHVGCKSSEETRDSCSKQGDDGWAHRHQNFSYSLGCDPELNAPRCAVVCTANSDWEEGRLLRQRCDRLILVLRRQLAYACQVDLVEIPEDKPFDVDWEKYDLAFVLSHSKLIPLDIPIPFVLFSHDHWWPRRVNQRIVNEFKPSVLLTPYPASYSTLYKTPERTQVKFFPIAASTFFTRPNLGDKEYDLITVGNDRTDIYKPRKELNEQVANLPGRYRVEISNRVGCFAVIIEGPTAGKAFGDTYWYLNGFSANIGRAKYAAYARFCEEPEPLFAKCYELLGSGAIPIMPEAPGHSLLGIKPWQHYIPTSEIVGDNDRLMALIDDYDRYKYIAENAVQWYLDNVDRMLFQDFEEIVREVTNYRYPKRIV